MGFTFVGLPTQKVYSVRRFTDERLTNRNTFSPFMATTAERSTVEAQGRVGRR